jgi:hypothetical protein
MAVSCEERLNFQMRELLAYFEGCGICFIYLKFSLNCKRIETLDFAKLCYEKFYRGKNENLQSKFLSRFPPQGDSGAREVNEIGK